MLLFVVAACLSHSAFCYVNNRYGSTHNVRSVLFGEQSVCGKDCWTNNETGLLLTRYIMQDLLPRKVPGNVTYLEQYITLCVRTMHESLSSPDALELLLTAFSDALGGYLHAYGLPLANEAYYEGTLDLERTYRLYGIEETFKDYLKTDGEGWTRPMRVKKPLGRVAPVKITSDKSRDYCDELILKPGGDNDTEYECPQIPMPFFDDCKAPRAIAVPIKEQNLYSLSSNESRGVLFRYYEIGVNCLRQDARCKQEYQSCHLHFNKSLLKWMKRYLLCHLNDGCWYPAFYGAKRILRTVQNAVDAASKDTEDEDEEISTLSFFMIVAFLLGLFWLIIVLCLLCRRCCSFKDDVNECYEGCVRCSDNRSDTARLFSYNMSCWTMAPRYESAPRRDPAPLWMPVKSQSREFNYVEVERNEVEEPDQYATSESKKADDVSGIDDDDKSDS